METQPKLNNSKEVIAYLAKQFPLCFIAEGEAKPLKIGIFQDLVKRLEDDTSISKTQLRSALRLYTTSWRYLYGIKVGAERVDLDGHGCGVLEQEHVDFAKEQLELAKSRVRAQKKEKKLQEAANPEKKAAKPDLNVKKVVNSKNIVATKSTNKSNSKNSAKKPVNVQPAVRKLSNDEVVNLKAGQKIKVKAGKDAMDAIILEINKEGARVQLASGMSMVVRPEHLVL